MATNEELAKRIQAGEQELLPDLWESVQRYVYKVALRWWNAWKDQRPGLEVDDLAHAGFIALCDRIGEYDPSRGTVVTWLQFPLLTAFCVEVGCRTTAELKRPEHGAVSLETPIPGDVDGLTIGDMIEDPAAVQAFEATEERLYQEQVQNVVREVVEALPDRQRDVVQLRHLNGLTLKETGDQIGVSLEMVRQVDRKALHTLRRNQSLQEAYYAERNLYRGTSLVSWRRTGCSVQELELLRKCR